MFNSYSSNHSTSVANDFKINAISGTIVKNYKESFFNKFHLDSELANQLFDKDGAYLIRRVLVEPAHLNTRGVWQKDVYENKKLPVVILQMMICGEKEVLCELMYKEDFDKMFNDGGSVCFSENRNE